MAPVDPRVEEAVKAPRPARRATAESMAEKQREISVSEFFVKNRHLLGFDNPQKALLTAVRECVDNSLDACSEAGILPSLKVEIDQLAEDRFRIAVEDNGPGIVKQQVPKVFGKLLYGSKFHTLKQQRGQQGIGVSAAGMYGQLTTGKPVTIVSRTAGKGPAHLFEVTVDTKKNEPLVLRDETCDWEARHGTKVEIELQADPDIGLLAEASADGIDLVELVHRIDIDAEPVQDRHLELFGLLVRPVQDQHLRVRAGKQSSHNA